MEISTRLIENKAEILIIGTMIECIEYVAMKNATKEIDKREIDIGDERLGDEKAP